MNRDPRIDHNPVREPCNSDMKTFRVRNVPPGNLPWFCTERIKVPKVVKSGETRSTQGSSDGELWISGPINATFIPYILPFILHFWDFCARMIAPFCFASSLTDRWAEICFGPRLSNFWASCHVRTKSRYHWALSGSESNFIKNSFWDFNLKENFH